MSTSTNKYLLIPDFLGNLKECIYLYQQDGFLSFYEIAKQRLKIASNMQSYDFNTFKFWNNLNMFTLDSILFHPNGNIKISYDSQRLGKIDLNSQIDEQSNGLIIEDVIYEKVQGLELTRTEALKYCGPESSKLSITSNPIWLTFFNNDKKLLEMYFEYVKKKHPTNKCMEILLLKESPKQTVEKPLFATSPKNGNRLLFTEIIGLESYLNTGVLIPKQKKDERIETKLQYIA